MLCRAMLCCAMLCCVAPCPGLLLRAERCICSPHTGMEQKKLEQPPAVATLLRLPDLHLVASMPLRSEPTTGLDARAAAVVMRAVKNASGTGRTVVCTM